MRLEFNYKAIATLRNPFEGAAFTRIKRSLVSLMQRQKDKLFRGEKDPDGNPWKPLSPLALGNRPQGKGKGGAKILQSTGALKNSLTDAKAPYSVRTSDGHEVALGTNLKYAAIQNFGGVIRPVSAKALAIPLPNGGVAFRKKVTIPARPFIGFGRDDESQVNEYLSKAVSDGMSP